MADLSTVSGSRAAQIDIATELRFHVFKHKYVTSTSKNAQLSTDFAALLYTELSILVGPHQIKL